MLLHAVFAGELPAAAPPERRAPERGSTRSARRAYAILSLVGVFALCYREVRTNFWSNTIQTETGH